jgi:hypothetical protein
MSFENPTDLERQIVAATEAAMGAFIELHPALRHAAEIDPSLMRTVQTTVADYAEMHKELEAAAADLLAMQTAHEVSAAGAIAAITQLSDALQSATARAADDERRQKQSVVDAFAAGVEAGIRIATAKDQA